VETLCYFVDTWNPLIPSGEPTTQMDFVS